MATAKTSPLCERLARGAGPHARGPNALAGARLERVLADANESGGRSVLLHAPRAGYGKTHLLEQCRRRLTSTHQWVPLASFSRDSWVLSSILEHLQDLDPVLPASGGVTALDLLIRRVLAKGLAPLIASGEVPAADPQAALQMLEQRPTELLDLGRPNAAIAVWLRNNFQSLQQPLTESMSRLTSASEEGVRGWILSFFQYACSSSEDPGRLQGALGQLEGRDEFLVFEALLALWSLVRRVVVVIDQFDDLNPPVEKLEAGMACLTRLRERRSDLTWIFSINDDVWDGCFSRHFSSGYLDRWSEVPIRLEALGDAEARALLESRGIRDVSRVRVQLELGDQDMFARRILQRAGQGP